MTDYNGIQKSIERSIAALTEDLELITGLRADPRIIEELQEDINNLNEASEIVWMYQDLEK